MSLSENTTSEQKIAVITGAGVGIGKACALRFAQDNYCIVVADLSEQSVEQSCRLINEQGGKAVGFAGDISIEDTSKKHKSISHEKLG